MTAPVPPGYISYDNPVQGVNSSAGNANLGLLDRLVSESTITQEQYNTAKSRSETQNISPEVALLELNILPEEKIAEAKAKMVGVPFVSLGATSFSPQALSLLPRSVVERFVLIPF